MPEYLAPGVFVEERPASLRAIEGVGTSTAAFVGPAERGPIAGELPPFESADGFVVEADPAPVLVTSYAQFVREFGHPLRLPVPTDGEDRGYLGHAVRAFFENGGRRVYVARVTDLNTATRNSLHLGQGVALRLTRRVAAGATELALNSLRGIEIGSVLDLRRRSDGQDALPVAATPATLRGTQTAPFALKDGDVLIVEITGVAPPILASSTAVDAPRAEVVASSSTGTFAIAHGDTLKLRVGVGGPIQTVTFHAADITPDAATPTEVALVLARDLTGASVDIIGNSVVLRSDTAGTDSHLEVIEGTAISALGFQVGPTLPVSGNVANAAAITLDEIRGLLDQWLSQQPPSFAVTTDNDGHLVLTSTATGAGISITASDSAADGLGLSGGTAVPSTSASIASITVTGCNARAGTVTLSAALPIDLEPSEVFVRSTAFKDDQGPCVHARSAGKWSANLRFNVTPVDRPPVTIAAPAALGAKALQVASASSFYVGAIIEIDHADDTRSTYEVTEITGNTLTIAPPLMAATGPDPTNSRLAQVLEIDILIADASGAAPDEVYRGLSWNQRQTEAVLRRHYATQINARSRLVYVQPPGVDEPSGSETGTITDQPSTATGFPAVFPDNAADGIPDAGDAGDAAFVGQDLGPGRRTGIQAFAEIPGINIVAAPGRTGATVQLALIAHCEQMRYRFAVLDGEENPRAVNDVQSHRSLYETSHAAYYGPWVGQNIDGRIRWLPPSGFVAGIYAQVDNERGVWKAPANEAVRNAFSLRTRYTTGEQEILNPQGVNLIRQFDIGGIRVWGARTLSSNPEVRYVNVRRTLLFIEASIERGTQWVVFEPNTAETWARLTSSVRSFLRTQWREGALFGRSEGEAFFVRCDESTMTADDVLNGRLICLIGVAIVRPAEFVIFRVEQLTGLAQA